MNASGLSIVVCTHNRRDYLGRVLDALEFQLGSDPRFEVIVVDNASSDGTSDLCLTHSIATTEVKFGYLFEPVLGLSHARNTGVTHATGDVVAFLDDDAIPDSGWASALLNAFADTTAGAAGGRVDLEYESGRPGWLTDTLELYLTRVDLGGARRALNLASEWVAGANIAFRRSLLVAHPFEVSLGRKGASLISGEETELCRRIGQEGWATIWVPEARVRHYIPATRTTPSYLRRRAYAGGYSAVVVDMRLGEGPGRPRALARGAKSMVVGVIRSLRLGSSPAQRVESRVLACSGAGTAVAALFTRGPDTGRVNV